jgi:predicted outer membrane repeat protein
MTTYRIRTLPLLSLWATAFVLLLSVMWLIRPAYAAAPAQIDCPANGDGPEAQLKNVIALLGDMTTFDVILINVSGGVDCLFTLTEAAGATDNGPYGLPLIVRDVTIRAVGGRAIIERAANSPEFRLLESDAKLTLENITLRNGAAKFIDFDHPANGGALYAHQALTLTNVVMTGNLSYSGGAIYSKASLVMREVTVDHNQTLSANPAHGGAIFVAGNLDATNITVTHNIAMDCGCGGDKARGGGIFVTGTAVIANALFQDNQTVHEAGGALYVDGDLTLTGSSFISNSAGLAGGGALVKGSLKLTSTLFLSNSTATEGGGVFVQGPASISNTFFISNVARWGEGGGLVALANRNVTVQASSFISNQAVGGGGAAVEFADVQHNLFQGNIATQPGSLLGGGGLLVNFKAYVQNNRFINNSASIGGGAQVLFFPIEANGSSRFINNLFVANNATENSGAAIAAGIDLPQFHGDFVLIHYNTIVGQSDDNSSAIHITKSSADIYNNVISQYRVGAHSIDSGVIGNGNLFAGVAINYIGTEGGVLDLRGDALFVNPLHADYRLQSASPARDSGMNVVVATDFNGVARPQGAGFDRGAFEFVDHAPVAQSESYTTTVATPLVVTAPGVLANDQDTDGDALTATVLAAPLHGDLILQPTGAFIYTPTAAFSGTDSYTYVTSDGERQSAGALVTLNMISEETELPVEIAGLQAQNDGPAVVGRAVHFVAAVAAGSDVHFAWDFGDGASEEGVTASHAYPEPGEYNVTLNASNTLGGKAVTTTVSVEQARLEPLRLSLPFLAK